MTVTGPVLPDVEYERFPNPPLRAMLGQVQFPPILRLQKGVEVIADLQETIRDVFPGFGTQQEIQITVSPTGDAQTQTNEVAAYRFITEDETWSALLSPTAVTLEAAAGGRYSSYEKFAELFRVLWGAVVEHLRPGHVTQQGLRYVDHLEGDRSTSEWAKWINADLLGAMAGDVLGPGLEHAVSELRYPREGGRVVFRHGIATAGPQNAKGYLLDFDAIHTAALTAEDANAIIDRFDESHDLLYRFFRWCVTDRALAEFRSGVA